MTDLTMADLRPLLTREGFEKVSETLSRSEWKLEHSFDATRKLTLVANLCYNEGTICDIHLSDSGEKPVVLTSMRTSFLMQALVGSYIQDFMEADAPISV